MKLTERKKMILIHIAWILALAVILWPLFTIAKYDYPSADDWSFGKYMYRAMQAGEGIAGVFHAIYQTLAQNVWEARFSILILSALQPAAFGEHFYRITPYLMIGSVILSQFLLLRECIAGQAKENRWLILPIGIPMAILQVLYCPYPEESFYWYNGSVNYTFVYSLSLVLLTLYLEIALRETGKAKRVVLTVLACLLAILVGGNNFSTSVSTMCLLICLQILFLICRKDAFRRTWIVTLLETLSVLMCVTSPLTATRLNGNFGGSTANSPLMAIWLSLERTFLNIISWTNLKVLLLLVLLIPFFWKAVRKMNYEFRFPGLFTALTFGVYASQATATIYVDGTMGGGRQGAILWYFYVPGCMLWACFRAKEVFYRQVAALFSGAFVCAAVFVLYPTCVDFRPSAAGPGLARALCRLIYANDAPVNVFPSLHCYEALVMHLATFRVPPLCARRRLRLASAALVALICLSTLLVKQHSVADLIAGCTLAVVMYLLTDHIFDKRREHHDHTTI